MALYYAIMPSIVGQLTLAAHDSALLAILWEHEREDRVKLERGVERKNPIIVKAIRQLSEYFEGQREQFDLPLEPRGTVFQKQVWKILQTIPYGKTVSYAEIAELAGNPRGTRAVASAIGRNPLSIVIPCHRVIGKNGSLTGFAGGLEAKAALLELESAALSSAKEKIA